MAEPVNLNKARKVREKARNRAQADANSAKFGRTKTEKAAEDARADKARAFLDQHRRDPE